MHTKILNDKNCELLKERGIGKDQFREIVEKYSEFSLEETLEIFKAQGLYIIEKNHRYYYEIFQKKIREVTFCIVDIETNGSKIGTHQIIEIGAVKMHRGKIIDTFDMLVKCNEISSHITEITGITVEMTKDALPLCIVIEKFRQFLADDIFVAHDINFDYNFISASMQKCQMLPMLNRKLCSIQLAERSIVSYRYKLSYLNDTLDLYRDATHHRALSDAMTTTYLLKHIFNYLPRTMDGVEELLKFSKQARRLKRPKFDPVQVEKNRTKAEI